MPGLVVFGRRWEAGSDDLVFPTIIETFVRLIWLILLVIVWSYNSPYLDCEGGHMLQLYFGGVASLLLLTMLINVYLTKHSMQGAIMEVRARSSIPCILYIRFFLGIPELLWTVIGSIWVFNHELTCTQPDTFIMPIYVIRGLVIMHWVLVFFLMAGIGIVFDPLGHHHRNHSGPISSSAAAAVQDAQTRRSKSSEQRARLWELRCKLLCCFCPPCCSTPKPGEVNINDAFTDVAEVLTSLFHDLDLVPSDIAAGLLLLHLRHDQKREEYRRQGFVMRRRPVTEAPVSLVNVMTSSPKLDSRGNVRVDFSPSALSVPPSAACSPDVIADIPQHLGSIMEESPLAAARKTDMIYDWMNPSTAYTYMKYAFGTYGWMWYLYGGFWKGLMVLRKELVCCSCIRPDSRNMTDDNCCHCNLAALKTVTDLQDKDILHVSFHNKVFEVPYYVAVDHLTASIVVAIRGTLSFQDALTDMSAIVDPISVEGLPQGWTAHRGMLQAANYVLRQLDSADVLHRALSLHPTYNLVVTGHSLGAGAAVLLSLLLKPRFPRIRCFAFSPPGCLLNEACARYTETFCMSVIIGDDLVPRLSLTTLELLKRQLIAELECCRHPKYRIFLRGCWDVFFGSSYSQHQTDNTHPLLSDSATNSFSYESLNEVARYVSPAGNRTTVDASKLMFLPGRIMQVEEREPTDTTAGFHEPQYEARWMQRDDYNQILVTPRMLSDHVPDAVMRVLQGLASQYEATFSGVSVEQHEA